VHKNLSLAALQFGWSSVDLRPTLPRPPRNLPVLVYVHGGGFCAANAGVTLHSVTNFTRLGMDVYCPEYPLSPENPFPAPVLSILRSLRWMHTQCGVTEVTLVGDSAGGNLVMVVCALLKNPNLMLEFREWCEQQDLEAPPMPTNQNYPNIASVVALYGVLDQTSWWHHSTPDLSWLEGHMARYVMALCWECFRCKRTGAFADRNTVDDLLPKMTAFPRCLLICGTKDPLIHSCRNIQSKLTAKSFDCTIEEYPLRHAFFGFPPGWNSEEANDAAAATSMRITAFLKDTYPRHFLSRPLQDQIQS